MEEGKKQKMQNSNTPVLPGPDLACRARALESQLLKYCRDSNVFQASRASRSRPGLGTGRAGQYSNNSSRLMRIIITFSIVFFCFATLVYASPFKGPWDEDSSKKISRKQIDHRFNPFRFLVQVYRTYISPIDGKNCPMYPTCSQYSLLCFEKHGSFTGWMMTCDRLFRCGRDELELSPWITVNGEIRCCDAVENNDFWWSDEH